MEEKYVYVMDPEEYAWNRKELLENRNQPYFFGNEPVSMAFFEKLSKEFPDATIYHTGIAHYVCLNNKAREELRRRLITWMEKKAQEMSEVMTALQEIEKGGS